MKQLLLLLLFLLLHLSSAAQTTLRRQMEQLQTERGVNFVYDAALPLDAPYHGGELKSLPLEQALERLFKRTDIAFSIQGNHVLLKKMLPKEPEGKASATEAKKVKEIAEVMEEVVVTADLHSRVTGTQMGKLSFSQADIKTGFALLSSPDVVKTLQRQSGVQEGLELASGLYVHGGNGDENLFLLDGTPLYSVNHAIGLFSSFNADVVKNVDFYKSGFPARYGGRLSSVVDVRTNDGDMQRWKGLYRIGLLDGSFQVEGPLQREKTSLNLGLRRSWLDLMTEPAFFIANQLNSHDQTRLNYNFHDLNLKLTHLPNDRQRLCLTVYSGGDALTSHNDCDDGDADHTDSEKTDNRLRWGNLNTALDWSISFSPRLTASFTAVYSHNSANLSFYDEWHYGSPDSLNTEHNEHSSASTIDDLGYRTMADLHPTPRHHLRIGHDYTFHQFRPQTKSQLVYVATCQRNDTLSNTSRNRHISHELSLYAEDLVTLTDHWSLNGGVNLSLFNISGKSYVSADPRIAVKFQLRPDLSLKASYTVMTQYVHKISNSFLDLPTDYWVPTTRRTRPMHSRQIAAGIYMLPSERWTLSVEGYYKHTCHLLQYNSWTGLEPPAESWDQIVTDGQGLFYGVEADAIYRTKLLTVDAAYTLSWNKRKFDEFYSHWYYNKFDNRHKLNLSMRLHLSAKAEMYAAWTWHTGNRMTLPTQYTLFASMPGFEDPRGSKYYLGGTMFWEYRRDLVYERPNNITLPAYHRLDMGFNLHHRTKHGHERIWNWSIYNAYCHLNTMWGTVKVDDNLNLYVKCHGYIPIVPSFSYTIKF
jgi:hypothetical protein